MQSGPSRQHEERCDMVGESEAMREVYGLSRKVAVPEISVLICGESGTGKEMVAHAIYSHRNRSQGRLPGPCPGRNPGGASSDPQRKARQCSIGRGPRTIRCR